MQAICVYYFLNIGDIPTSNHTGSNEILLVPDRILFSLDTIKQKVHEQLSQTKQGLTPMDTVPPFCKNLRCKCIFAIDDYYENDDELRNFNYTVLSDADKQSPVDVSNVCLTILDFLILDGNSNLNKNLEDLYADAMTNWDRQHKADDIMTKIFYSSYQRRFAAKYQLLKAEQNDTGKFIYDLPNIASWYEWYDLSGINEVICDFIINCTESLLSLTNMWQRAINVLDFPWDNFPLGTYLANYNYLLDQCAYATTNFQTDATVWRSNPHRTDECTFSKELLNLHNDLGHLLTQIIPGLNISLSLVDFVGLLGYSEQFDITAIKQDDYVEANKVLLPLYGWDRRESVRLATGDVPKELEFILCIENVL